MNRFSPVNQEANTSTMHCCSPVLMKAENVGARRIFPAVFGILGFLLLTHSISAQQQSNYTLYANIIYRVTKYIDWPAHMKSGEFVIGIVGNSPLYDALQESIFGKTVGDQRIIIKRVSIKSPSFNYHMLFIGEDESHNVKKIAMRTAGAPTLIISESEGLAAKGSCINFIIESDRLKLEINKANISGRDLGIASELLKLGKIVK
jgi:hypothetical protein